MLSWWDKHKYAVVGCTGHYGLQAGLLVMAVLAVTVPHLEPQQIFLWVCIAFSTAFFVVLCLYMRSYGTDEPL